VGGNAGTALGTLFRARPLRGLGNEVGKGYRIPNTEAMFPRRSTKWAPLKAFSLIAVALGLLAAGSLGARAQDIRFFRIGTGSISGVYFPVGGLIASAISNPPGSRACATGGSCGVPGLIAVAQATLGSVANVRALGSGKLESALVQADVARFAHTGTVDFAGEPPIRDLRAIASLYPEIVHIVVRGDSPIKAVGDLAGRRVSLDLSGSGTRAVALAVLAGYGVDPAKLKQINSQIGPAADRIRLRAIDAFFFVGGYPSSALARLARSTPIRLLSIDGAALERIRTANPYLAAAQLPADTYRRVGTVNSIAVHALWLVSAKVDADTVFGLTRALWHPSTRRLLDHGVSVAGRIRRAGALRGVSVPLHPGAARYYREKKLLNATP
jgi:TRAP transporter TAXI family solute receptor